MKYKVVFILKKKNINLYHQLGKEKDFIGFFLLYVLDRRF